MLPKDFPGKRVSLWSYVKSNDSFLLEYIHFKADRIIKDETPMWVTKKFS